jgi:hypothetical protein
LTPRATGCKSRSTLNGRLRYRPGLIVGLRLGHHVGADVAGSAGPVVDHELLLQVFGEALGQQTREGVGAPARRRRHHHPHRPRRPGFLGRRLDGAKNQKKRQQALQQT